MELQPLFGRVIVDPDPVETESAGGIILGKTDVERPIYGTVRSVGGGVRLASGAVLPMSVAVGDRVLYPPFGGQDIKFEGRAMKVILDHEILAVVEAAHG
jgi:chaperonin GroES